ncbi:hypothetical protein BG842_03280 [Haladaptatus sp. W1]|uniref:hypothetical protein n=1 Tax=Haladaptatus sp. W1 TaxID=1897478 RepID=UPI0008499964|nr:hypothetical protein [Haladaptatus sp. W1]ODR79830.1 hypothetical protein BG842_03280 [Haladaptatus sp. W1]
MPTYDIVEQGADDTGGDAIDGVLENLVDNDTTIIFPPGTYKLNELIVPSGTDRLELIAPDGARLVPGRSGDDLPWIDVYARGFTLDGFELDMRNTAVPPFVRMNSSSGYWELRRLITRGYVRAATDTNIGSNDSGDARTYFRLSAEDGTRGLLQDCYFHEGSCAPDESSNRRAILVESGKGVLIFNRCWFEHWGENTIYAKKPEGRVRILNSFVRNSQNGMRLGGDTQVRNCVSIKDAQHPRQAWSGGSLQRGVNVEANVPTNPSDGVNSYDGTISISDCDFYHRYLDSSCGGAITAVAPCQRIDIQRTRVSYDSTKNHDAIYTYEGTMYDGTPANLEYLRLEDVQVTNDHDSEYAIYIGQEPDTWGPVSGVLGGSGPQTNSSYIESQMTINGNPTQPNTTPPLPSPPPLGEIPMESAQLVRIDNRDNDSRTTYQITAGDYVLPAGNDGTTISMWWGPDGDPRRPPNSGVATGTAPGGSAYAFYVTGGIISTESDGPATWTVDGEVYNPGTEEILKTDTITSGPQENKDQWKQANSVTQPGGVAVAKPLSFSGSNPAHVRLRNVADDDFEYKLEEWAYLDGSHVSETFHTLAMGPSEREIQLGNGTPYKMKAGSVSVQDGFATVSFDDFFGAEIPIIFAQAQTFNGPDPIVTRLRNVSSSSFNVRLQEEEARGGHTTETVGYIALEPATGRINGTSFEVRRDGVKITDEWSRISFQKRYNSPRFIAGMQTFNGSDTANLRYRNLTGTGVEVKVEEEQSANNETTHTTERVGYFVIESSL